MKRLITILLTLSTLFPFAQIRVIGYLPNYRWDRLSQLDYEHLSHVGAAFINPDLEGNILFEKDMHQFVRTVHQNNCLAEVSLCGGGDYSWGEKYKIYEKLIETPESRNTFIKKIVSFLKLYNLDGLDNDMEGKALELKNYNIFSQELADAVHAEGLEYTAALGVGGQWGIGLLSDETMLKHDFIMTMSYGGVGNWNWKQKPDDGTYNKMLKDVNHLIDRGLPKEKAIGGVPFYYTEFPQTEQTNYAKYNGSNCDIYSNPFYEKQNPWQNDTIYSIEGNPVYINSIPTYYRKIDLAIKNNSGFMIWEIAQDCFSGPSIMDSLANYMDSKHVTLNVEPLSRMVKVSIGKKGLKINCKEINPSEITILKGSKEVYTTTDKNLKVDSSKWKKGEYTIKLTLGHNKEIYKKFNLN